MSEEKCLTEESSRWWVCYIRTVSLPQGHPAHPWNMEELSVWSWSCTVILHTSLLIVAASLGHGGEYFSAICWLYGKYLYQRLGYPIGLIVSAWGGTPIQPWMSADALKTCRITPSIRETSATNLLWVEGSVESKLNCWVVYGWWERGSVLPSAVVFVTEI